MKFCLEDGTALVSVTPAQDEGATWIMPAERGSDSAPTQASPTQPSFNQAQPLPPPVQPVSYAQAEPRRRSPLLWILAAALVLGLSGIIVVALILNSMREDKNTLTAQTATPTPVPVASLTPETVSSAMNSNSGNTTTVSTPTPLSTPTARQMNTNNTVAQPSPTLPPPPKPSPTPKPSPLVTPTVPSKTIGGGVLNGKAIRLPTPAYPPIARAARASGTVMVQVTIDENGNVISAHAISGHPLLQASAVAAARGARFSPTLLSGQPVKVTGVITYNFVAQ